MHFLTQVIKELLREIVLLGLVLTNKEGLVRNVKFKGSLGCSYHKKEELKMLREKNKAKSRITTLGNKKGCYRYISSKRNTFGPAAEWGRGDGDKGCKAAKVPSAFFALVFTGSTGPLGIPSPRDRQQRKTCPWWKRIRLGNI